MSTGLEPVDLGHGAGAEVNRGQGVPVSVFQAPRAEWQFQALEELGKGWKYCGTKSGMLSANLKNCLDEIS